MPPPRRTPEPAYPANDSKILYGDRELYERLGEIAVSRDEGFKRSVEKFEIPIRSGKAWVVRKG